MLKKFLNVNWEADERNIRTVGGQYLGTAKDEELALVMAAGPKLLRYLLSKHEHDQKVMEEVSKLLQGE